MQASEQLQFGPYNPPKLKIGDWILDENRGMVQVVGISNGRIPWPVVTSVLNKRARSLALYGDLVRAVHNESGAAIRHWWGVSLTGVTTWRKALGVPRSNPGSYELWRRSCAGPVGQKARAVALPVLQSPEYSAKRRVLAAMSPRPKPTKATLRRMRLTGEGTKLIRGERMNQKMIPIKP